MNGPHRVRIVNGMKVLMSVTSFNISNSLCLIALCYGYLDKRRLSPVDAARLAVGQAAETETETGFEIRFINENIGKIICKH